MEQVVITLNDFLFNAGILGFYRILKITGKENLVEIRGNTLYIEPEVFQNFEEDYINAMMEHFEKDTRWYKITSTEKIEWIKKLDLQKKEETEKLEEQIKEIKKIIESASYKSGLEIIRKEKQTDDPNEYLKQIKIEKDSQIKRKYLLAIIEHLKNNKEVYCMKDIIYNKINVFWENVAFLNTQANKNNMQQEYKKAFVDSVGSYLEKSKKAEYNCIECGNYIGKSEARGLAFLKDVGTDEKRKKSAFWNFNEDAFVCPICSLIYSCTPIGFTMVGSNAIFINNNESFKILEQHNAANTLQIEQDTDNFEKLYSKVLKNYINRADFEADRNMEKYEPENIQVIKRVGSKDAQKYEINIIATDKLEIFKRTKEHLRNIVATGYYTEVADNILTGKNQFRMLARMFQNEEKRNCVREILMIQIKSKGGKNVKEQEALLKQMIDIGESLKKSFFVEGENENKLKSYSYKLQRAIQSNNINDFRKLFVAFYGGMGRAIPSNEAVKQIFTCSNIERFKALGYAYVYGIEKYPEKREGGKEDEK